MVFSTITFVYIFLPITLLLYFAIPKIRNYTLLAASLIFYMWGGPKNILILLGVSLWNYLCALFTGFKKIGKAAVFLAVTGSLAILAYYKYTDFFISTVNQIGSLSIPLTGIIMPIGISFFTFQALSYTIDVYRKDAPIQKNPFKLLLYISMFPQLIAGPIVRYQTVAEEINRRSLRSSEMVYGIERFIIGLFKKVIIANQTAAVANAAFDSDLSGLGAPLAWLGIICYTLQIYFDFSAYSDMGIGIARMMGFHFLENFNYPYIASSATDFWRRWHISLSTWFRDYVYIPLGGNRCSAARNILNLTVVWFLTGLWHGANFTFVLWGLFWLVLQILEKYPLKKIIPKIPRPLMHIYTLAAVLFSWILFRASDLSSAGSYLRALFSSGSEYSYLVFRQELASYFPAILCGILLSIPFYPSIRRRVSERLNGHTAAKTACRLVWFAVLMGLLVFSTVYMISSQFNPFIYWQF